MGSNDFDLVKLAWGLIYFWKTLPWTIINFTVIRGHRRFIKKIFFVSLFIIETLHRELLRKIRFIWKSYKVIVTVSNLAKLKFVLKCYDSIKLNIVNLLNGLMYTIRNLLSNVPFYVHTWIFNLTMKWLKYFNFTVCPDVKPI